MPTAAAQPPDVEETIAKASTKDNYASPTEEDAGSVALESETYSLIDLGPEDPGAEDPDAYFPDAQPKGEVRTSTTVSKTRMQRQTEAQHHAITNFFDGLTVFYGYHPNGIPRNWWEFVDPEESCEYGTTCLTNHKYEKEHKLLVGLHRMPSGGFVNLPVKTTYCNVCGKLLTRSHGYGVPRPTISQHPGHVGRRCKGHEDLKEKVDPKLYLDERDN